MAAAVLGLTRMGWCHICDCEVPTIVSDDDELECTQCQSRFVEELNTDAQEDDLRDFIGSESRSDESDGDGGGSGGGGSAVDEELVAGEVASSGAAALGGGGGGSDHSGNGGGSTLGGSALRRILREALDVSQDGGGDEENGRRLMDNLLSELDEPLGDDGAAGSSSMLTFMQTMSGADGGPVEIYLGGNQGGNGGLGAGNAAAMDALNATLLDALNPLLQLNPSDGAGGRAAGTSIGDYALGDISRIVDQLMQSDPGVRGNPPASRAAVARLEEVTIGAEDVAVASGDDDDDDALAPPLEACAANGGDKPCHRDCPVCQEEFEIGEKCKKLPCQHVFHPGCILPWLKVHNTCPVCRHELPVEEDVD